MDRVVVYIEEPPTIRVVDGLVHIEDKSGNVAFQRVMSVHNFRRLLRRAGEALALWDRDRREVVVPFIQCDNDDDTDHAACP